MQRLEKTRAFLTEFIIVILFFTISSVITVQLFVAANKKSAESISITQGYLKAETLAEQIKANIDFSKENVIYDYMTKEAGYILDENKDNEYYFQYFDKDYKETDKDDAYIYGIVSIKSQETSAGLLYNIIVSFNNNSNTIVNIDFNIYDGRYINEK